MQIEVINSEAELARLGPEWSELVSGSDADNPFLHWEWCSAWWRHYGDGNELVVVLARDGDRLVGLAPLYLARTDGGGRPGVMKFLGTNEVCSEYLDFALRPGYEETGSRSLFDFLLHDLCTQWRQLQLTHIPATTATVGRVEHYLRSEHEAFRIERGATSWQIDLAGSWDEFQHGLSRSRREKYRRARRDMEKHDLRFHEVGTRDELGAAWDDLKRLHQARWEQQGTRGCFASSRFAAFHAEMLSSFWQRGMLSLTSLRHGERTVAASYSVRHRGHVYFYQAGVDPAWLHCRPGHSLRCCEVRRAIERGDRVFDFLGGDEEYKSQWATRQTAMLNVIVAGRGLLPRVRFGIESAGRWMKESARTRVPSETWATLKRWRRRLTGTPSHEPDREPGLGTKPQSTESRDLASV